jgi:hypothetical protein
VGAIPISKTPSEWRKVLRLREERPILRHEKRPRQGIAVDRDLSFLMRENWNDAVSAKRREGGRFQDHVRPNLSGAKIIEPTKGGFSEKFRSEIDADFGIVVDGEFALQSVDRAGDRKVFATADDVQMLWREHGRDEWA